MPDNDKQINPAPAHEPNPITTEEIEGITKGFMDNLEADVSKMMDKMQSSVENIMEGPRQDFEEDD